MNNLLDILVILDRSGSMEDARSDHEGGLRSFIRDQKDLEGDVRFTLVQFDTNDPCEIVYDRVPIQDVGDIHLIPRGGTPLLDGIGMAMAHLSKRQAEEPSSATVVMIITDGKENASTEWTTSRIKARIDELEKKDHKFLYLGANVDAFHEASMLGVPQAGAINYLNQTGYAAAAYGAVSSNLRKARSSFTARAASAPVGVSGQSVSTMFKSSLDDNMGFTEEQRSSTVATDSGATTTTTKE